MRNRNEDNLEYTSLDERFSESRKREKKQTFLVLSFLLLMLVLFSNAANPGPGHSDTIAQMILYLVLAIGFSLFGLYFSIKGYDKSRLRVPSIILFSLHIIAWAFAFF